MIIVITVNNGDNGDNSDNSDKSDKSNNNETAMLSREMQRIAWEMQINVEKCREVQRNVEICRALCIFDDMIWWL